MKFFLFKSLAISILCFSLIACCGSKPRKPPAPYITETETISKTLLLNSVPDKVKIYWADGEYRGETPLTIILKIKKEYWSDGDISYKWLAPIKSGITPRYEESVRAGMTYSTDLIAYKDGYQRSVHKIDWGEFTFDRTEARERTIFLDKLPSSGKDEEQQQQQQQQIIILPQGTPTQ